MRITINHHKSLTEAERNRLNGSDGGWDSEPRFSRYANVSMMGNVDAVIEALTEWDEYDIVADMEVTDLEDAFEKSNSIRTNWLKNDEVTFTETKTARSSSVGDIFSDPDTGKYWLVAAMGFEDITDRVNAAYAGKHKSAKAVAA